MPRIELMDSVQDVAMKMSDGNPGGLAAIVEIVQNGKEIDPQDAMAPMGAILRLDSLGIYGSSIYVLWAYKCGRDVAKLIAVLRANQLGIIDDATVKKVAADQSRAEQLDVDGIYEQVCERLEQFKKPTPVETA